MSRMTFPFNFKTTQLNQQLPELQYTYLLFHIINRSEVKFSNLYASMKFKNDIGQAKTTVVLSLLDKEGLQGHSLNEWGWFNWQMYRVNTNISCGIVYAQWVV